MLIRIKKAQSTLEYAGLLAVVVAAVITMQSFVRSHIQGRIKSSADSISDTGFDPGRTQVSESTILQGTKDEHSRVFNGVSETVSSGYTYVDREESNTQYDASKF